MRILNRRLVSTVDAVFVLRHKFGGTGFYLVDWVRNLDIFANGIAR